MGRKGETTERITSLETDFDREAGLISYVAKEKKIENSRSGDYEESRYRM